MTWWLGSLVVECSHGQRKAMGSSPGRATSIHLLQMAPNVLQLYTSNTSMLDFQDHIRNNHTEITKTQLFLFPNTFDKVK